MSAEPLLVRAFSPEDYEKVLALWLAAGLTIKPSDSAAEIAKLCAMPDNRLLVAELRDGTGAARLVGAVIGAFDGRRAWIYHLAVDPRSQRRGIATSLMREIERHLRSAGARKINLLVEPGNQPASYFYRSQGYRQVPFLFFTKGAGE